MTSHPTVPAPPSHREIASGIWWIQELGPERPGVSRTIAERGDPWYAAAPRAPLHIPQNAYLLVGDRTLLFDTLSPAATGHILSELGTLLGGRPLDYLVVSHPDVPHAGNTHAILRAHEGARLVAPRYGDTHALYHLGDCQLVGEGDEIDLGGGLVAQFHEATFLDAALSVWMSERSSGCLFPVDWLGAPIRPTEAVRFADELEGGFVESDRYYEFHARVMFWFQYVDTARVATEIERLWQRHRPRMLAPSHGPVVRSDTESVFRAMPEVVRRIRETGRTGVL